MAIETSKFWEYDLNGHFYYLTVAGAEEYTGYDISTRWKNASKRLKKQGRDLHRFLTTSAHNVKPIRYRHKDIIEYFIFLNPNDEQQAVIDMLSEIVEWAWEEDGDKKQYEDKYVDGNGSKMPQSVIDIGKTAHLYFKGEIHYEVPEDEYRVGY
jgi:hypothetical protein